MNQMRKRWMRFLGAVAILCLCVAANPVNAQGKTRFNPWRFDAELTKHVIKVDGWERIYWVYAPPEHSGQRPRPVVMLLHGGGGKGSRFDVLTKGQFKESASRDNIILVYPEGYRKQWNDGRQTKSIPAQTLGINDVKFLSTVIDEVVQRYDGDANRVAVGGISNGGMMANRLACEIPEKLTSIAVVVAALPEKIAQTCAPTSKVSVILMNGVEDPLVPYEGGEVTVKLFRKQSRGRVLSAEQTFRFWASQLGFDGASGLQQDALPDHEPKDGTRVVRYAYSDGSNRDVVLYKIWGGGHTWPGGMQYLPKYRIGRTSHELNGTATIWSFFKTHW